MSGFNEADVLVFETDDGGYRILCPLNNNTTDWVIIRGIEGQLNEKPWRKNTHAQKKIKEYSEKYTQHSFPINDYDKRVDLQKYLGQMVDAFNVYNKTEKPLCLLSNGTLQYQEIKTNTIKARNRKDIRSLHVWI